MSHQSYHYTWPVYDFKYEICIFGCSLNLIWNIISLRSIIVEHNTVEWVPQISFTSFAVVVKIQPNFNWLSLKYLHNECDDDNVCCGGDETDDCCSSCNNSDDDDDDDDGNGKDDDDDDSAADDDDDSGDDVL